MPRPPRQMLSSKPAPKPRPKPRPMLQPKPRPKKQRPRPRSAPRRHRPRRPILPRRDLSRRRRRSCPDRRRPRRRRQQVSNRGPTSNPTFARLARRNSAASIAGDVASSTSCRSSSFLVVAGAGGIFIYARYRLRPDPQDPLEAPRQAGSGAGQALQRAARGGRFPGLRQQPDPDQGVRRRGRRGWPAQRRHDGGPLRTGRRRSVTVISIPRDLWVDIPANSSDISGHEPDQRSVQLRARPAHPDDRDRPSTSPSTTTSRSGSPDSWAWSTPSAASPWTSPPRSRTPTPDSNVTTPGCQVVNGTTSLQLVRSRHLEYMNPNGSLGIRRTVGLQPHPAPGLLLPGRAGQGQHIDHQSAGHQRLHRVAVGNLTIDDTLSESDLFRIADGVPGPAVVAPRDRDAAHDELRHRRGCRRAPGGPALRRPDDRRVQPARRAPSPNPATTTTTTVPPLANSVVVGQRPQRLGGGGLLATDTAPRSRQDGFQSPASTTRRASSRAGDPSEILYGPSGLPAAKTLAALSRAADTTCPTRA